MYEADTALALDLDAESQTQSAPPRREPGGASWDGHEAA
jgi:hypothetical protein